MRENKRKLTPYAYEFESVGDIVADPVIEYMSISKLEGYIAERRSQMLKAAKNMEFMEAARLRDEIIKLEQRLEDMRSANKH